LKIIDKVRQFTAAREAEKAGIYPYFRPIESEQGTVVRIFGKPVLMLGSNNYLGLTNHPEVKKAAQDAIEKYGTGCAGSRFLNGTLSVHLECEEKLAAFMHKESALLFTAGFLVNQGVISTLVGRDSYVICDKLDHASILEGARLAFGKLLKFEHNDMDSLRQVLSHANKDAPKLIVADGIFSMEGDIANLPEIVKLAEEFNAEVMVDDAHSIGVLGPHGEGTAAHFGVEDKVDLIMGTFSKSLASIGGFIAGSEDFIHYLKHFARALIFVASPPPASVASVIKALEIIQREPERQQKLWENTRRLHQGLKQLGFNTRKANTPILPVVIGDDLKTFLMCKALLEEGIFVNPVVSPAVPPGDQLIRLSLMSTHTFEQIDFALEKIEKVARQLEIL